MTLIVGLWCGDSAVLCADSQETRGGLKSEVNKLPIGYAESGGMDIVCGGAGNGPLADAFRDQLIPRMVRSKTVGETAIQRELEQALVAFHQGRVFKAYPGTPDEKLIAGLVSVRSAAKQVHLFHFFGSVIRSVRTYELAGEDYAFLERVTKRLYRDGLTIQQAILIGLDVVNEGKATSIYVGGPTRVVVVRPDSGMQVQESARISWTEAHISTQNELLDDLRFNLGSSSAEAQVTLKNFANSITSMRGVYGTKYLAWPKPTLDDPDPDEK
jgi:20S proteasome alpha/beta subunit